MENNEYLENDLKILNFCIEQEISIDNANLSLIFEKIENIQNMIKKIKEMGKIKDLLKLQTNS